MANVGVLDRRRMMQALVASWLVPVAPALAQRVVQHSCGTTLAAFVDALLPQDAISPSATSLGVDREILDLIEKSDLFSQLFSLVCPWLDGAGGQPFTSLSLQDRGLILDYMAAAGPDVLEGRFYQLVRLLALEFYYAHPDALAGLDLAAAPQPTGYPPPWV